MLGASALAANGQTLLKGIKFTDNWSVGINGGVTTPMTHCSFWKNSRPAVGIELSKRITPVLSLGTSVMGNINTLAVAALCDVGCIVLAEGISLDDSARAKAVQQHITVLSTDMPIFDAALKVHERIHA